jgi:hypothetical protein
MRDEHRKLGDKATGACVNEQEMVSNNTHVQVVYL